MKTQNCSPISALWPDSRPSLFVFASHQGLHGDSVFSVASQFQSGVVSSAMEGASGRSVFFSSSNRPRSVDDHSARQVRVRLCPQFAFYTFKTMEMTGLLVFKCKMQSGTCLCSAVAHSVCLCHFQCFKHHILFKQNFILQPSCVTWSEDVSTNKELQGNAGPEKQEVVSSLARWYLFQCQSYSWHGFYSQAAARPEWRKSSSWSAISPAVRTGFGTKPEAKGHAGFFGHTDCPASVPFTWGGLWQTVGEWKKMTQQARMYNYLLDHLHLWWRTACFYSHYRYCPPAIKPVVPTAA